MEILRRLGRRIGRTRFYQYRLMPWTTRLDRVLYPLTGGRLLSTGPVLYPTLLLTTVGRRTGEARTTPLFYVRDGERILLASSIRGAWAKNLLEHPGVSVRIGRRRARRVARPATDEEVATWWPRFTAFWPPYEVYRQRSGQRYVYVLEPVAAADRPAASVPDAAPTAGPAPTGSAAGTGSTRLTTRG